MRLSGLQGRGVRGYIAYDLMHMTAVVTAKEEVDGEGVVELQVRGRNSLGDHVTATVRVALPD